MTSSILIQKPKDKDNANRSVDELMSELETVRKHNYKSFPKQTDYYGDLYSKIAPIKNAKHLPELLLAIQDMQNKNDHTSNLELGSLGLLFVLIQIFPRDIDLFPTHAIEFLHLLFIEAILLTVFIILFFARRRKNYFYKLAYNILASK